MSSFRDALRKYNVPDLAIQHIVKSTNDVYDGYRLYVERKILVDQLAQLGIEENEAYFLAFKYNNIDEAAEHYYGSFKYKKNQEKFGNNEMEIVNRNRIEELDQTSTTSIYISAPGVVIEGKQVVTADRDEAIMLITDFYGKRPLDPKKSESFPKYQVIDPASVELNCVICQNNYLSGEVVTLLPCNHYFHVECIEQYFKFNNVCPIDKTIL